MQNKTANLPQSGNADFVSDADWPVTAIREFPGVELQTRSGCREHGESYPVEPRSTTHNAARVPVVSGADVAKCGLVRTRARPRGHVRFPEKSILPHLTNATKLPHLTTATVLRPGCRTSSETCTGSARKPHKPWKCAITGVVNLTGPRSHRPEAPETHPENRSSYDRRAP